MCEAVLRMPAGAQDAALLAAVRGAIREGALPTVAFTVGVLECSQLSRLPIAPPPARETGWHPPG